MKKVYLVNVLLLALISAGSLLLVQCSNDSPAACLDKDNDNYIDLACGGSDCNDDDPNIHPDAIENCANGIDDNCDGKTDDDDPGCNANCGGNNQPCCSEGTPCSGALLCQAGTCKPNAACGAITQQCCNGTACNPPLTCQSNKCQQTPDCGTKDKACCATGTDCGGGLICQQYVCKECSAENQPCCKGDLCTEPLTCQSGSCKKDTSCGDNTQTCCTGNKCYSPYTCDGTCKQCGNKDESCCSSDKCNTSDLHCDTATGKCKITTTCGDDGQTCCASDPKCNTANSICDKDNTCRTSDYMCTQLVFNGKPWSTCITGTNTLIDCIGTTSIVQCTGACVSADDGRHDYCTGECGTTAGLPCCKDGSDYTCSGSFTCNDTEDLCTSGTCGGSGQSCCTGNTCDPHFICQSATCVACGTNALPCCTGNSCDSGYTCNTTSGKCEAQCSCCAVGQPCCSTGPDKYCNGTKLACNTSSSQCEHCGAVTELCCEDLPACDSGLNCNSSTGKCETAPNCGAEGQTCCADNPNCASSTLGCYGAVCQSASDICQDPSNNNWSRCIEGGNKLANCIGTPTIDSCSSGCVSVTVGRHDYCQGTCGTAGAPCCYSSTTRPYSCNSSSLVCGTDGRCSSGPSNGDTCADPVIVTFDANGHARFNGMIDNYTDNYPQEENGLHPDLLGKDIVFKFTIGSTKDLFVTTVGSTFDTALYLTYDNTSIGIGCGDPFYGFNPIAAVDTGGTVPQASLTLTGLEARDYYLILDSQVANATGSYVLDLYVSDPGANVGDRCGNPYPPIVFPANTSSFEMCTSYACGWPWGWCGNNDTNGSCGGTSGRDAVRPIVFTETKTIQFYDCGSSFDSVLSARTTCTDLTSEVACNDDSSCPGNVKAAVLTHTFQPGIYYLWLDGINGDGCLTQINFMYP